MKEIKFRAWTNNNQMLGVVKLDFMKGSHNDKYMTSAEGFPLSGNRKGFHKTFDLNYAELLRYTGLKDKNGTEIYEGDIVENASKDLKFQVVYEAPSFNCKWIDDTSKRYREHLTEPLAWNTYIICEVIGNIYENPELLGDSQ